jgi:hypothetical protein
LKRYRGAVVLEAGGMLVANLEHVALADERLKQRAGLFFRALATMGYAAVNVAPHELATGLDNLRRLSRRWRLPLLSANIVQAADGRPAFRTWLVRAVAGQRLCFFGLTTDAPPSFGRLFLDQGLAIRPPVAAAREAVQALARERCDLVVALTHLRRTELEALGREVAGIHLLLGSSDAELSTDLERMGSSLHADAFAKGKHVAVLALDLAHAGAPVLPRDLRQALVRERVAQVGRVQIYESQIDAANTPGSPLRLTASSRATLERQLAEARGRLRQIDRELAGGLVLPSPVNTADLQLQPLEKALPEDRVIRRWVKDFSARYPGPP